MKISDLMPTLGKEIIDVKGTDIISLIGEDAIKSVVSSLLCGENIRNLTEPLTRRRLNIGYGALLKLFLHGSEESKFIKDLPKIVIKEYKKCKTREDKIILQWLLGLTGKSVQNVLRSKESNLNRYLVSTEKSLQEAISLLENKLGDLSGSIDLNNEQTQINWLFISRLFTAIGAQTLAIRGSEKSLYGKLFERLALGCLLTILDFKLIDPKTDQKSKKRVFWLSDRGDKRESDATLLLEPGKGIRFDMGFIGPGNPEISLDKVSRFEKVMEFGEEKHFMLTFIIVDRIGKKSRIVKLAQKIDGTIIQMSMAYWPKLIADKMNESFGFKHRLNRLQMNEIRGFIEKKMDKIDLNDFLS